MNILERVRDHVYRDANKLFSVTIFAGREDEMTYGQLWEGAEAFARLFAERGIARGQTVLILVRQPRLIYHAFVGAILHGAIPAVMPYCTSKQDPALFWANHKKLFDRIQPGAIVTFRGYEDLAAAVGGAAVLLFDDEAAAVADQKVASWGLPDGEIAFLQHSSGTTGQKKGVMLSHEAIEAQVASYAAKIALDATSVVASWLPLYHDMGLVACFITPMLRGATIVQLDAIEWVGAPLALLDQIEKRKATHVWLPNFAFNHMMLNRRSSQRWDLSSLQAVIDCSEPCKIETVRQFAEKFADCSLSPTAPQICYAMAETVFAVTQTPLGRKVKSLSVSRSLLASHRRAMAPQGDKDAQAIVSCGTPIPGMRLRIIGDSGWPVGDGEVGEICVTGSSLYSGYDKLPEVTAAKLRDGWHFTGDLGFRLNENLYVTGRKDDLLIVRGRNFYAHEVEDTINKIEGVYTGRVVAFSNDNAALGTAEVVCLVELREGSDPATIRRTLRTDVEAEVGVTVGRIVFVSHGELVKTTSGKISREANRSRYLDGKYSSMVETSA